MSAHACCGVAACGDGAERGVLAKRAGVVGRVRRAGGFLVPGAVLTLLPKCPLCLAAYIAAGTGIGISGQAAAGLRAGLIGVSVAALLLAVGRTVLRA